MTCPLYRRGSIYAYGSEITTSGAISGVKFVGKSTPHGVTVHGMKINHRGNASAVAGFEIAGTDHLHLIDPVVEAHGVSASYATFLLRNADGFEGNQDYGSFWTTLTNPVCRKRAGADPGSITRGVELRGGQRDRHHRRFAEVVR